jgi:putative tricarboxylic transport membrane protein
MCCWGAACLNQATRSKRSIKPVSIDIVLGGIGDAFNLYTILFVMLGVITGFLVGALTIHGVTPGPTLFQDQGRLIYAMFTTMVMANMCNFIFGRMGLQLFGHLAKVPSSIVYPVVLLMCLTGAWISGGEMIGCIVMVIFGIAGYVMRLLRIPIITFVIAFVLWRMWELPLIQMMELSGGSIRQMINHPVAVVFFLAGIALIVIVAKKQREEKAVAPKG